MGSFDWRRADEQAGNFVLLRPRALRVFGLPPHDALSMRQLLRMVPRDDRHGLMRVLRDVLRTSSVLATDVPVTLLDGRQRIVHVEAEPEFNEHGYLRRLHRHRAGRDRPAHRRRPHPPSGQLRRADRPAQPAPADLARRARARAARRGSATRWRCC